MPRVSYNGVPQGGGGGASLPVSDPADVFSGATASRLVGINGSGDGALFDASTVGGFLGLSTDYARLAASNTFAQIQVFGGGVQVSAGQPLRLRAATNFGDFVTPGGGYGSGHTWEMPDRNGVVAVGTPAAASGIATLDDLKTHLAGWGVLT